MPHGRRIIAVGSSIGLAIDVASKIGGKLVVEIRKVGKTAGEIARTSLLVPHLAYDDFGRPNRMRRRIARRYILLDQLCKLKSDSCAPLYISWVDVYVRVCDVKKKFCREGCLRSFDNAFIKKMCEFMRYVRGHVFKTCINIEFSSREVSFSLSKFCDWI